MHLCTPPMAVIMFDGHKQWDPKFKEIWGDSKRKWVEPLRMSPIGVWTNLLKRCGDGGARILKYFPDGVYTNPGFIFPAKPKGYEYARNLVSKQYWR